MLNLHGRKYQGTFRKQPGNSGCLELGLSPGHPEGPLKDFNRGTIGVGMPRIQNVEEVEKKWSGSKAFPPRMSRPASLFQGVVEFSALQGLGV